MSGVLALALKRKALSRGTVPSAVPMGHALDSGTNGTNPTKGGSSSGGTNTQGPDATLPPDDGGSDGGGGSDGTIIAPAEVELP